MFFLTVYCALFVLGFLLVSFSNNGASVGTYNMGRVFGVWALTALSLQFILSSRSKILEKGIGLDNIMLFHSYNARLLFAFALLHPLFLGVIGIFKINTVFHWLGVGAILLLMLTVATTLFSGKLRLNYEYWKIIHKTAYLILALGLIHSFFLGSDFLARGPVFYWWLLMITLAFWGILTRVKGKKYEYEVVRVIKETYNVRSVVLKPLVGEVFDFKPGQFAFVRFMGDISSEEHHFTISSSPGEKYLSFTIKELGDYTSAISKLKKGDKALLDGPYGVFTNVNTWGPFLFIAGGIGITPVMSMIRYMSNNKKSADSVLLYIQKTKKDLVFAKEIEAIARQGWLKVYWRFTEKEGHVDRNFLENVKEIKSRKVFLVGPVQMINDVKKLLGEMGVSSEKIQTEQFALR